MTNSTPTPTVQPEAKQLGALELGVLKACHELTLRQRELLPLLAATLQVPESEVLYAWALRKCPQRGVLPGTDWTYFFHGLECDLQNQADGRFLRIDFGPKGRVDTFTLWGVLQFIMTSVEPWPEFPELKRYLARSSITRDRHAGATEKMSPVWERLTTQGMLEPADPVLLDFAKGHTSVEADGLHHVRFPQGTSDETVIDCSVAGRMVISPLGFRTMTG